MVVPISVAERRLRGRITGDVVLEGTKLFAEFFFVHGGVCFGGFVGAGGWFVRGKRGV
jgi:hypothetical protein